MSPEFIFIPAFREESDVKHGGQQRTAQIIHELKGSKLNIQLENPYRIEKKSIVTYLFFLPYTYFIFRKYNISFLGLLRASVIHANLSRRLKNKNAIFLIEGCFDSQLIAEFLIKYYKKIYITFPQNIEFTMPGYTKSLFKCMGERFLIERDIYRQALYNFTISNFDAAIVNSLFASAGEHCFYPEPSKEEILRYIKLQRGKNGYSEQDVLVIGSVSNMPTKIAFENFLENINKYKLANYSVKIAGLKTETLSCSNKDVEILGSITNDELVSLLENIYCVIIPVIQTTGFITRLVEMNIANIPVILIGEYIQGENLQDFGVYNVRFLQELPDKIKKIHPPKKEFTRTDLTLKIMDKLNQLNSARNIR